MRRLVLVYSFLVCCVQQLTSLDAFVLPGARSVIHLPPRRTLFEYAATTTAGTINSRSSRCSSSSSRNGSAMICRPPIGTTRIPSASSFPAGSSSSSSRISRLFLSSQASATKASGRKRLATGMAFLAGWANLLFFFKFKSFATMLTGNTLWMALATMEGRYCDFAYYGAVIGSYLLGTAVFRRTDLSLRKKTLPVCSLLVATLFVLGDWIHYYYPFAVAATATAVTSAAQRWIPMILFSAAYGIINSLGTEVTGTLTFVVTGHFTRLVNQWVDRWSRTAGRKPLAETQRVAVLQNSAVCGGFAAGAIFAGFLSSRKWLDQFGVFSAIGIFHAALWLSHDMEAIGGAWWLRKDNALCDLDDDGRLCEEVEATTPSTSTTTASKSSNSTSGTDLGSLKP